MIDTTIEDIGSGKTTKLTDEEICGHSLEFVLAGHETTAGVLSFTSYLLALHPDVQEKLQAEIDEYYKTNPVMQLYLHVHCHHYICSTGGISI